MRKLIRLWLVATAATAILTACGGSTKQSSTSQPSNSPTSSGSATDVLAKKQAPASLAVDDSAWNGVATTTVHTDLIPGNKATRGVDVSMQALYSDTDIWFRFQWRDATNDNSPTYWQYDGSAWKQVTKVSDRLALYWEITPVPDFEARGCAALCHRGDNETIDKWYMVAPRAGDVMDNWQWTANTSAPVGQSDDLSLTSEHDPTTRDSSFVADPDTGGGTVDNVNADETAPTKMQDPSKTPSYGPNFLAVSEAITLDASKLKAGAIIPSEMLAPFQGDRGDIGTKTSYANGQYTVVFHRKLDTGHPDDAKFVVGNTYPFGLAVWDQAEDENHTVTGVVYHLLLK